MALDLGTLVAHVDLDDAGFERGLARDKRAMVEAKREADAMGASADTMSAALKRAAAAAERAAQQHTAAARAEADAVGRLRVAEEKLNVLRQSGKATADQLAAGEERLAKAHRDVAAAQQLTARTGQELTSTRRALDKAGADAAKSFAHSLTRGMRAATFAIAGSAGNLFSAGGPVALAILAGIATLGIAVIGPALAAAVTAGFGLGMVGIPAMLLRDRPLIVAGFRAMGEDISDTFRAASSPLQDELLEGMLQLRALARNIAPEFRTLFSGIAPVVQPLINGLSGMVQNMLPGIRDLVAAARGALIDLAAWLPRMGDALGDVFNSLADAGPGAMMTFTTLADAILGATKILAEFIQISSQTIEVTNGFALMVAGILPLLGLFSGSGEKAREGAVGVEDFANATSLVSERANRAKEEVAEFRAQIEGLNNPTIAARRAQLDFLDSLTTLADGLKENGRSFSFNSAKGRENHRNLLDVAEAAGRAASARAELSGVEADGLAVMDQDVTALRKLLRSAGLSTVQVNELTGAIAGIPARPDIPVGTSRHTPLSRQEVSLLNAQIRMLRSKIVTAKANGALESSAQVRGLRAQISALQSKNVFVRTYVSKVILGDSTTTRRADPTLGGVLKRATGGPAVGSGTGTSDSIPALLSNGEHVWTAREVQAAGGHGAMRALRAAALSGRAAAFATGGAVGTPQAQSETTVTAPQIGFRVTFNDPRLRDLIRIELDDDASRLATDLAYGAV